MIALRCVVLAGLATSLAPFSSGAEAVAGRILVRNGTLFTLRSDETEPRTGYLLAGDDGRILRVGYGDPPPDIRAAQVVDAAGKFVMPGFVSAHCHIYQAVMRGLATDQALGGWLGVIRPYIYGTPPGDRYFETLSGCFDLLRHGVTTAFNFNDGIGHPELDTEAFRAELASGMRFVHGYCLPVRGTRETRLSDFEAFYAHVRAAPKGPTFLGVALGGYSCVADDKDYAMTEGGIMSRYGLYNQAHYLEPADPKQVSAQRARFDWFSDSGELGPRLSFGHLVHADDAILGRIAAAGAGMVWNPLSNGRLASGIVDIPKIMRLGIRIGMGVDGQASADVADPFENMRTGLYLVRAQSEDPSLLQPRDVLRFHTLGSADVIGVADRVGSLEAGKFADFLIIDPHSMDTGPVFDPYGTLVLACGTPNIEAVYVAGRIIVDHGNCVSPEFARVSAEAIRRIEKLRATMVAPNSAAPAPRK